MPRPSAPTAVSPHSGIFTDGGCSPNPGPGGWGVVVVEADQIREQWVGGTSWSTNNRMELTALIRAITYVVEEGSAAHLPIYADSQLCVQTYNEWMEGWAKRGWRRKTGPVENLDLVQELYALKQKLKATGSPVTVSWIKAHAGLRWNEYADQLVQQGRTAQQP
ncbi:MAG: ribonuclease H [Cyanobacteriota bacterium]|nr:ribonuclease H [Cyanobacteriota bacterium]